MKMLKINFFIQFMALSNLSEDEMLTVKSLTDSYNALYKKDVILVHLVGKNIIVYYRLELFNIFILNLLLITTNNIYF